MTLTQAKGNELQDAVEAEAGTKLDPATIALLVSLIGQAVQAIIKCYKSHVAAAEAAKNPGIFVRLRLRLMVRDAVSGNKVLAPHRETVFRRLLDMGGRTTAEELASIEKELH